MAAFTRQTCSVCGAVLSESSGVVPPRCESCWAKSPDIRSSGPGASAEPSDPTKPFPESPKTVIVGRGSDTGQNPRHLAATLDFVPSADPTEPTASASDDRVAKNELVGRFRVISILGRGTFGTVYRAFDPLLDREVALKVPRFAPDDREMTERFQREAKAAARLHHPNIVTLYEHGQTDEGPYLVSEFVNGVPLSQMLREQLPSLRQAVDWTRQIAEGLHYAHTEGIVHRDVKPANIMMNVAGRPQIMDFGLAKRVADVAAAMTVEGQIVGTPTYMSPEQARGAIAEVGPHSDQYSVGVVLYEMLVGRPPFTGDPWTIISRVASERENPPPPRSVRPEIPRDLEACCLKALEKNPKARYSSLLALADDLDHWLKGLPLLARPIGPAEQLLRWCRQNRLIASMGGTLAVIFLAAAIVGPLLAVRYQDLADIATRKAKDANEARDLEKKAHRATENARELEQAARLATERSIIDSYTETGLTAHRNNDPREAILWFSNAVAASQNFPSREKYNRIRMQSWLSQVATPVQAFQPAKGWKKSLSYHFSGQFLLSLAATGECELLQLSNSQRHALPIEGPVNVATFSPDGKLIALATGQEVVVFEFPNEAPLKTDESHESHPPPPSHPPHTGIRKPELDRWTHPDAVNELQFCADGQLLVVGGSFTAQVRDVLKKSFHTGPIEVGSQVLSAAMTPDGRRFAVRCFDQKVRLYSCESNQPHSETLLPARTSTSASNLRPLFVGNDRLVVSEDFESLSCWDIDRKEIVWKYKTGRVLASAISPNGKWIALAEDATVALIDTATGEPTDQPLKHSNLVDDLSFHPTSSRLLTACIDHTAHVFDVPSGKPVGPPIPHCDAVHRCAWSADGDYFATLEWSGDVVRVWKPSDHRQEETLTAASAHHHPFVRINDRGDRWIPSGFNNWRDRTEVEIIDLNSGKLIEPKLTGPGLISDADFVPKSPLVVIVGGSTHEDLGHTLTDQKLNGPGFIRFVNSETGVPAFEDVKTPSQPIAVRTSPDGRTVVVLCNEGHLLLLDPATGKLRAQHQAFNGQSAVFGFLVRDRIRFSARGDQFAVWGTNALAELRKTDTGERIAAIQHESGFIHDAQFSPDGKLLATGSSDHSLRLWDTVTGLSAGPPLAHSGWIFSAQFSQDGQRLLTASSDKQARIWDLATMKAIVATREHGDQVFSVTFLPGEEMFLASTRDGQITAWDASFGKMIAPARQIPGMIYQLSHNGPSSRVIASGNSDSIRSFDWKQWIPQSDMPLSRDDVRLLGEILSSQRVHEGGAATRLTSAEWIERWNQFQEKHPDGPVLRMSSLGK